MNIHLVSTIFLIVHWLIIAGLLVRVIMRRAPVGVSLAWLAVIFSIPLLGAFVYLMFGEKRLGRRRAGRVAANAEDVTERQNTLRQGPDAEPPQAVSTGESMQRHAQRVLGFPVLQGNKLELLEDFQSIFDAIVADIDAAERSCSRLP